MHKIPYKKTKNIYIYIVRLVLFCGKSSCRGQQQHANAYSIKNRVQDDRRPQRARIYIHKRKEHRQRNNAKRRQVLVNAAKKRAEHHRRSRPILFISAAGGFRGKAPLPRPARPPPPATTAEKAPARLGSMNIATTSWRLSRSPRVKKELKTPTKQPQSV